MARVIDERYEERDGRVVRIQVLATGTRGMNVAKPARSKRQRDVWRTSRTEAAALRNVR